jgi:PncC family amidohydrolase
MRVALVAVGDELLRGDVTDTNTPWLVRALTDAGHQVARTAVVGDDAAAITAGVAAALADTDGVVVYGGLGPTPDDVTAAALAALPGHWDTGTLPNRVGSAPGLLLRADRSLVAALPGVPQELRVMAAGELLPALEPAVAPAHRTLHTALVGERALAAALAPLRLPAGGKVAFLPEPGEVRLRIAAPDAAALAPVEAQARALLGDLVVGADEESLTVVVHRLLARRAATLAVAESLTGGLLGAALTDVAGASTTFRGGITAYATEAKAALLGVDRALLARVGAVHPDVALAMARGARERFASTYALATTGVAGPDPQDGRPPGSVHVALAGPDGDRVVSPVLRGDRAAIRRRTVVWALDLARRSLAGLGSYDGNTTP